MNAIEIRNLSKTYLGKKRVRVEALQSLDLDVPQGEVIGFLGPNGAGKSTTIKVLTGQIRPTRGTANLFGRSSEKPEVRKQIGYLPENPALYEYLNAREYLRYVGKVYSMDLRVIAERTDELLDLLELSDAVSRPIRSYSKGMVQRLGLAQAILPDPDLFILDEPMSGLDPLGRALVKRIINDLKQKGKTVFFSTHITGDVEEVCDRLAVIVKGRLRAFAKVDEVLQSGTKGYRLFVAAKNGLRQQVTTDVEGLQEGIDRALSSGLIIERIEPDRRNLEEFFLDTVSDGDAKIK